jgi:hypothetical protein
MAGRIPQRLFVNKVNVQRVSGETVDSRGLKSTAWSDLSTNNACRLQIIGEQENRDGRNTIVQSWILYLDGSVDIKSSDRIYEPSTDRYYEIDSITTSKNRDGENYLRRCNLLYHE